MKSASSHPLEPAEPFDELTHMQDLLDAVPPPFEPLDVSALDGYLCGVILQPLTIPASRWLGLAIDAEGRDSAALKLDELRACIQRRHVELSRAITQRQWFDPWVFEPEEEEASPSEAVAPWVAGFAVAMEHFPALMGLDAASITEPLALLYRHLDADDLEDADDLLAEIETMEPPVELAEAVEDLVRATLLLADASQPVKKPHPARRKASSSRRR